MEDVLIENSRKHIFNNNNSSNLIFHRDFFVNNWRANERKLNIRFEEPLAQDNGKKSNQTISAKVSKNSSPKEKKSSQDEQLKKIKSRQLYHILCTTGFESGMESEAEKFVRNIIKSDEDLAYAIVSEVYMRNISKPYILMGILHLISHLSYEEAKVSYSIIAIASLSNINNDVKELAVQCFENWDDITTLGVLENLHTGTSWLDTYIEEVIRDKKAMFEAS